MSLPEDLPGDAPLDAKAVEGLQAELRALRTLFNVVLLALIILIVSLFSFMLREMRIVGRQIEENSRYVAEYKRKVEPRLNELHSKLFAYSKLHTNFAPVLVKYFGATNIPSGTDTTSSIPSAPPSSLAAPSQPITR